MLEWDRFFDWESILWGVALGVTVSLAAAFMLVGILDLAVGDFVQAAITYLPAGFYTTWRSDTKWWLNCTVTGIALFVASAIVVAVQGSFTPAPASFFFQLILGIGVAITGGMLAILLQ